MTRRPSGESSGRYGTLMTLENEFQFSIRRIPELCCAILGSDQGVSAIRRECRRGEGAEAVLENFAFNAQSGYPRVAR